MKRSAISIGSIRAAAVITTIALALLAGAAPAAGATGPKLVKDINLTGSSYPSYLTQVGSTLFFVANDGVHGTELWKSDGTTAGTKMVKDIRLGVKGSAPEMLVNVSGKLFFLAGDGSHGRQLWKSDGTKAGTVMVGTATVPGAAEHSFCPDEPSGIVMYPPVVAGTRLFYFLSGGGCLVTVLLYVSDGTAAGTHEVGNAEVYSEFDGETRVADTLGSKLYFLGYNGIWVTDGTDAGTHRLAGGPADDSCGISFLPAHGVSLYFTCSTEDSVQLWKTDGTTAGTKQLTATGQLKSAPADAVHMGTRLYFNSFYWDSQKNDWYGQLWKTNGTAAGTKPILTLKGSYIHGLTTTAGRLYFTVGQHLWKSDGTAAGTIDLGAFGSQLPTALIGVAGELCFAENDGDAGTWSLWESNGTKSGTYAVGTFAGYSEGLRQATVGSRLFFAANDITHGVELWRYTP